MREIKEIIVHCTATKEGKEITVAAIDRYHRSLGWSGIGYHYLIHLDGTISEGRDIAKIGAHTSGHNTGTIGICYVGGLDAAGKKAKDTRTEAQKKALIALIKQLKASFPNISKVSGHRDYARKSCPCFNAKAEYSELVK